MTTNRSAPTATVVPVLIYEDVGDAIDWLCRAFGFAERLRAERNGVIGHAQLAVEEGAVMLGRQGGPFSSPQANAVSQYVHIPVVDVDRHFQHAKQCGARMRLLVGVLLATAGTACGSLLGPSEAGLSAPKDPGRVVARVRDQAGLPVERAYVCLEMPNSVGSFFKECSWTGPDGMITFSGVPAGRRPVELTPPNGFTTAIGDLRREVDVVKGRESTVDFALTRA